MTKEEAIKWINKVCLFARLFSVAICLGAAIFFLVESNFKFDGTSYAVLILFVGIFGDFILKGIQERSLKELDNEDFTR